MLAQVASAAPVAESEQGPSGCPDALVCPLSFQLMTDPVVASDGVTYQRDAILECFDESDGEEEGTHTRLRVVEGRGTRDATPQLTC
jgi:hypothetical protein